MQLSEPFFSTLPTEHRIASVQGAANAAVGAMTRLSHLLPPLSHPGLEQAGGRLAESIAFLEANVMALLGEVEALKRREKESEVSVSQTAYALLQHEYDTMQEMLVALKHRYESTENECRALERRLQEAEARHASLKARATTVSEGLDRAIQVVDRLIEEA